MRRLTSISVVAAFAVAILLVITPNSFEAAAETQGGQPWGSWLWLTHVAPGVTGQTVAIFHQDGSMTCAEGPFAGYPSNEAYGPGHGTWEKDGGGTFLGVRLLTIFDITTGVKIGIQRGRFYFHFVPGNFDQIEGKVIVESLSCPEGPFACPDPLDPAAVWTPVSPPEGWRSSAKRIHTVPVD